MRDCVRKKGGWHAAVSTAALLMLSACATPDTTQPSAKISDVFATPEWAKANQARASTSRAITQNDLISAEGQCAASPDQVGATQATDGSASPTNDAGSALAGQGQLPTLASGIALGMTECQVMQRTGFPDTFNISAEGTERIATVTVLRGSWPGLYRFRGGRLVSIERVNVPAPAKTARPAKAKKTASKSQPAPLRGTQQ